MSQAVAEACKGAQSGDGGPFGAVIVKNDQVIAIGHNMVTSTNDPTAHAEITVIRAACKTLNTFDLSGCQLYTSCYPCPMCMGAALWSRLDAVYYAATQDDAASVGFDDREFHNFLKDPKTDDKRRLEQLVIDDYMRPFELWSNMADKIHY